MSLDTAILIPSYNSNAQLDQLIDQIKNKIENQIIIVDDGSPNPVNLKYNDVSLIRNESNIGKGGALRRGFDFANKKGFSHVVTMDSDLQHDPSELPLFIDEDIDFDFVLGLRDRDCAMPISRKFSNRLTSFIISKVVGQRIVDSQCGYRRYRLSSIDDLEFREMGFQFESEVLIKAIHSESKIKQIKISTIYDKNNKSYIKHFSDTLKFIRLIVRSIFRR